MSKSKRPLAIEEVNHARRDPRAEPPTMRPAGAPSETRIVAGEDNKDDRGASLRRQLAQVQAQLVESQRQLAGELHGRAEDAERIEELGRALAKCEADTKERDALIREREESLAKATTRAEATDCELAQLRSRVDALEQEARTAADNRTRAEEALQTLHAERDALLQSVQAQRALERASEEQRSALEQALRGVLWAAEELLEARRAATDRLESVGLRLDKPTSSSRPSDAPVAPVLSCPPIEIEIEAEEGSTS